ncbi:aminotransferase class V-fold PLP-dependent enzyme [Nibribacter ruber]|uniref:Aminotransferase class V-fold PLP-dependent enzyme n=1 Tax=Nibribacter ruber TaxID=2698458 RepID=A0A6P1NQX7_9BACT|nr:aminotransferase class I/II-fold pyridoxal phosphate-dependent enzyme [Nibribacter ruber]QHL86067.1 aminotransferase class V-fold PLP-dependent enzyme [Nibribacter ruber]
MDTLHLEQRLHHLEQQSLLLEPSATDRLPVQQAVEQYAQAFLEDLPQLPVFVDTPDKGAGLLQSPIEEEGIPVQEALGLLKEQVDTPGINPASGGHMGYIPGGSLYYSGLGDYLAAVTNRYAGIFYSSPGAVRMENMLIRWMAQEIGFPQDTAGNLTSGGSIASLIALVTARDAQNITCRIIPDSVIYCTSHTHHCLDKALRIAGLGECQLRHVPMDAQYRMDPKALQMQLEQDKAKGLKPWLLIASAGTTDVGAVDPLAALADLAQQHGLWYHVDAAYGGFFALSPTGKQKLKGIERADSVVMDPHKGLFIPYGSGAVLIKNSQQLTESHHYQASYMQDTLSVTGEVSPADVSPELSKHFRGLRIWLPLKLHGVAAFRSALEEKLLLAQYTYQKLQGLPGFEVPVAPDLSVVIFRYLPEAAIDANAFNQKLIQAVQKDGRVFLSSTLLDGQFMIRFAILSFRTHKATLDLALEILQEKAKEITASWQEA